MADVHTTSSQEGLNGEQPLQSLKDELPDVPASPCPSSGAKNSLAEMFRAFAKFGDSKADGKAISLSQSDKWMKQAKVIDGKKITATDTGIYFKKYKSLKLGLTDYQKFLEDLAKAKKVELAEIRDKMIQCGIPGTSGTTVAVKTAAVDRLTDSAKYTGSSKMRFDDSGRGRGIDGRHDKPDGSGYVQGYNNKSSNDKSH